MVGVVAHSGRVCGGEGLPTQTCDLVAVRLGDQEKAESHTDRPGRAGSRHGRYGPEVREALIQLWKVADRVCSKRLRPMIIVLLPAL